MRKNLKKVNKNLKTSAAGSWKGAAAARTAGTGLGAAKRASPVMGSMYQEGRPWKDILGTVIEFGTFGECSCE